MAGVLGTTHDVQIGDNLYKSVTTPDNPKEVLIEETVAPKLTTAANRGIQDLNKLTPRVWSSWHEGGWQELYGTDDPMSAYRYNDSSGIDISEPGKLLLLPATANLVNPGWDGSSGYVAAHIYANAEFAGAEGAYLYWLRVTTSDTTVEALGPNSGNKNIYDLIDIAGDTYCATGNEIYKKSTSAEDWTASTVFSSGSDDVFRMVYWNANIYGSGIGAIYKIPISTGVGVQISNSWNTYAYQAITLHENALIYTAQERLGGPWTLLTYDGTTESRFSELPIGFTPARLYSYMGILFVAGALGGHPAIYYFVGSTGPTMLFYDEDSTSDILGVDAYLDKVYFTVEDFDGTYCYNLTYGGISKHMTGSGTPVSWAIIQDGKWVMAFEEGIYKESTNKVTSGYVTTGMDYYQMPTQNKVYSSAELITEPLPAGSSVRVYYRLDNESSFTELDSGDRHDGTSDTAHSYDLVDANGDPLEGRGIEFKIELYRATDTTVSPVVNSLGYYFAPKVASKRTFKLQLAIIDNLTHTGKTAATMKSELDTDLALGSFDFQDNNYSSSTYKVRCTRQHWRELANELDGEWLVDLILEEI